jgi:hypothetical protein
VYDQASEAIDVCREILRDLRRSIRRLKNLFFPIDAVITVVYLSQTTTRTRNKTPRRREFFRLLCERVVVTRRRF